MISAGLATISCNYDIRSAILGKKTMNVLCIGHGGGSIPLFLASQIQGALVHIVEIDPLVISASVQAMGFPSYATVAPSGERACPEPNDIDKLLWKGTHERLFLYECDAENFIPQSSTIYDMIFIDAYDGDDIFPHKLWDTHSPFLEALGNQLHPEHGTVVVNLHSTDDSSALPIMTMGKYISGISRAYKDVLLENSTHGGGIAYTVSVPWVCNSSLVVSRGFEKVDSWGTILNSLMSRSLEVEILLDLKFSCFPYIKRGFVPVV